MSTASGLTGNAGINDELSRGEQMLPAALFRFLAALWKLN